jgi:hypothetical protein
MQLLSLGTREVLSVRQEIRQSRRAEQKNYLKEQEKKKKKIGRKRIF